MWYLSHVTPPPVLLRRVPLCSQSWWVSLSASQCFSPPAGWTLSGATLGDSGLPLPRHPHNDHITTSLHPGPLCWWGWGKSHLWLHGHPANPVYSSVPSADTEEAVEVFASLASALDFSVGWFAPASRDTCSASFLCNLHWTQLYPFTWCLYRYCMFCNMDSGA